jgi:hypothetical protein
VDTKSSDRRDQVVPEQVEAIWSLREPVGPPLAPEAVQLLAALRVALGRKP